MSLESILETWGYPALFAGTVLEGETPLLLASFLAHQGYLELRWVIVVAFTGTLLTDQALFHLGRIRGPRLLERRPAWRPGAERVGELLQRHGTALVLGFRFLYGLRVVTPAVIGMSGFASGRFLLLNSLSAALWATVTAGVGFAFGQVVERLLGDVKRYEVWVILAVALVSSALWLVRRVRNRRRAAAEPSRFGSG
jgi:membrane protein DedA with SNARE-associated domain